MPPLDAFLLVCGALLGIGLFGVLSQRSIVMVMLGFELMLNGLLLAVVAFWFFVAPGSAQGQLFALVVLTLMAVEAAVGFAILIAVYRGAGVDRVDAVQVLRD